MSKKLSGVVFLAAVFAVPLFLLLRGGGRPQWDAAAGDAGTFAKLEQTLAGQFPSSDALRRLQVSLNYMGGGKEQNGVFISGGSLTLDVQPKSLSVINDNTLAMIDFADDYQIPSYVMLIPTACAVQQGKVPYDSIAPLYNQPQLIDDVYRRVSGHVTAINVYPTLFNHQDEYIYYNTDNTTTGLGGFYIYTAVAKKLGLRPRALEDFSIEHIDYDYYGDLYALSPYREVSPDRVSVYNYNSQYQRSYTVTHYSADGTSRRYYTLYPKFKKELGGTMDVPLGGLSPVIDIDIGNPSYINRLLIFGDRSVQSYLPFLLIYYEQVTFVDTATVTPELLQGLKLGRYNQVLFAFSVDSYVSADQLSLLSGLPAPPGRQS